MSSMDCVSVERRSRIGLSGALEGGGVASWRLPVSLAPSRHDERRGGVARPDSSSFIRRSRSARSRSLLQRDSDDPNRSGMDGIPGDGTDRARKATPGDNDVRERGQLSCDVVRTGQLHPAFRRGMFSKGYYANRK
jgi:hypothetical protein